MAVSPAYTFDYEVSLRPRHDGGFEATGCSLQTRNGTLPGLLGDAPVVTVHGDVVRFAPDHWRRPSENFLAALCVVVPPLHNWFVDRRLRRASVDGMELIVPELAGLLHAGAVLRVTSVLEAGVPVDPPHANVSLHSERGLIRTWDRVRARFGS